MRVYISADMEGISGVVHPKQTEPGAREYDRMCALMAGDVSAAVEGALAAGATRVVVNDSHWDMRNLHIEALHPQAELISGSPKPLSMVQGVDEGFDAALFIGYHARAGSSPATIDHTYTEDSIYRVLVNDHEVGELGINALFAGWYGVPVVCVSGDQTLAAEAEALIPGITAIQVKHAYSRSAARCLPLPEARERIRSGVKTALGRTVAPYRLTGPYTLTVEFMKSQQAAMAALMPGTTRPSPRSVAFTSDDYTEIYRAWRVMYNLAG